jgi:hypothetical protein
MSETGMPVASLRCATPEGTRLSYFARVQNGARFCERRVGRPKVGLGNTHRDRAT